MKTSPFAKTTLFPTLALVFLLSACSFGSRPTNPPTQPVGGTPVQFNPTPPASDNSNSEQITMSGVINKTYTPYNAYTLSMEEGIVAIYLTEDDASAIVIAFPSDKQPGTYPIEDRTSNSVVSVGAIYNYFGDSAATYFSTAGTLTLSAVGSKYSGQFQFTAVDIMDASKKIEVTGSFSDLPFISP